MVEVYTGLGLALWVEQLRAFSYNFEETFGIDAEVSFIIFKSGRGIHLQNAGK